MVFDFIFKHDLGFFCSHTILFVEHLGNNNNNNNKSVLIVSCLVRVCRSGYACFTLMLWPLVLPNGDLSGEGGFTVLPVGNGFKTMVAGKGKVEKSECVLFCHGEM